MTRKATWWRRRSWFARWSSVTVLPIALIVLALWMKYHTPIEGLVSVRARSEAAEVKLDSTRPHAHWYFRSATAALDGKKAPPFKGELEPGKDASVRFERLGKGRLYITFAAGRAGVAAKFTPDPDGPAVTAHNTAELLVEPGDIANLTFPFAGRAVIGELVGPQTSTGSPILLDGSADVLGKTWITQVKFISGHTEFRVGDQVEIAGRDSEAIPSSVGFVRVDSGAGMLITHDAFGEGVRTRRLGSDDAFVLKGAWWSPIQHDWKAAIIVFVLLSWARLIVDEVIKGHFVPWVNKSEDEPAELE